MSKKIAEKKTQTEDAPRRRKWIWWVSIGVAVLAIAVTVVCLVAFRPIPTEVSADLDACIREVLYQVHRSDHTEGKYPALTYTTLCVEEEENTTTVYGVMMYCEYTRTTYGELRSWGSANEAFAITAKKTDGGYEAVECWWPKLGKEYAPSIQEKFPRRVRDAAINAYQYFAAHDAACKADAEQNIAAADQYVVMQSDRETVRLAYCPDQPYAYVIFMGGYSVDGTYVREEDAMVFTFGENKIALSADGDRYVYRANASSELPREWVSAGEREYFVDGVIFAPEIGLNKPAEKVETAPVGPGVVVSDMNWLDEAGLQDLFGQYIPSDFSYDTADVHYLPSKPVETRDQLDRLIELYADSWTGLNVDNFAQYDTTFFEDNYLLMTYYKSSTSSAVPQVDSYVYVKDGDSLWLSVRLAVEQPSIVEDALGQWLLFSGIAKEDYKKATGIEAYVEHTETKDDVVYSGTSLTFTGKVKQVEGGSMLMECYDVDQFINGVWVELGDVELTPAVGAEYVVTYEDTMMLSYPPRVTAITITPKS